MNESYQNEIGRTRPPRVQITYDVEIGDAIQMRELPFIAGILADLSGDPESPLEPLKERKFVQLDRDNFDEVLEKINPRLELEWEALTADQKPNPAPEFAWDRAKVVIDFTKVEHFEPQMVVQRVERLNTLYVERKHLRDLLAKVDGNDALHALLNTTKGTAADKKKLADLFKNKPESEWGKIAPADVAETIINDGKMVLDEHQKPTAMKLLGAFATGVFGDNKADALEDSVDAITLRIGRIDEMLRVALDAILHHEKFRTLEGSWRGLHYLVDKTRTGKYLKLRLLNATRDELLDDMSKAVETDQSALFKKIYEAEYGTFGGDPFSVLIGDYEIGRLPQDFRFLEEISKVAAAAHAPFITNAKSKLFDISDYSSLHKPRDLTKLFESQELISWREFRETEDSRYVTLTMPRVLIRRPYDKIKNPVKGLSYSESIDALNSESFVWSGAAYILAERITNAFSLYKWTAAIRGVEGGGLVEGLPLYDFKTAQGDEEIACPTEVAITDRREKELNDLGFMAICHQKGSSKAAFFGGQSTNQPKLYNTDEANANSRISSMLPYVMAASRFAHYIKVIMRDKIGSFLTRGNVEDYLNTWISQYVLLDDSPPQEIKARYPLRQAKVVVADIPGRPGSYRATVFLKPHFQLEELTTSIRLVADLPA